MNTGAAQYQLAMMTQRMSAKLRLDFGYDQVHRTGRFSEVEAIVASKPKVAETWAKTIGQIRKEVYGEHGVASTYRIAEALAFGIGLKVQVTQELIMSLKEIFTEYGISQDENGRVKSTSSHNAAKNPNAHLLTPKATPVVKALRLVGVVKPKVVERAFCGADVLFSTHIKDINTGKGREIFLAFDNEHALRSVVDAVRLVEDYVADTYYMVPKVIHYVTGNKFFITTK